MQEVDAGYRAKLRRAIAEISSEADSSSKVDELERRLRGLEEKVVSLLAK
jgi:polyhydroxyalkanoate synthesis regulator phasin